MILLLVSTLPVIYLKTRLPCLALHVVCLSYCQRISFQEYVETLFTLCRLQLRKRGPKPCAVQILNLVNPVDQEIDHKSSRVRPVGHNRYVGQNSIEVMCSASLNFYLFSSSCLSRFIFVNTNVKLVLWFVHCTFASLRPLLSLSVSFFQFTSVKPVEVLS